MSRGRRLMVVGAAVVAVVLWPSAAGAHPLGNFTVNVYDGIVLSPGGVRVQHVVDMAEIPTFQELRRLDGDAQPSNAVLSAWASRQARAALKGLTLSVEREPVTLTLRDVAVELRPGQAGLPILRLQATYAGPLPRAGTIDFRDGTFPGRVGWREMTVVGTGGTAIRDSSVPTRSVSNGLRSYPQDLLSSPLRVTSAAVSFGPGPAVAARAGAVPTAAAEGRPGVTGGAFASLAVRRGLTVPAVALSLVLALGFGAVHALGPGHGKAIMAAYLIGTSGRSRQALAVAGAVAAMHTASVVVLGVLVLAAQETFPAERVYPWLGLLSGAAALALGVGLLVARLIARARHRHHGHTHPAGARPLSARGLAALALSGGILPSPTAIVVLLASIALGRVAFGLALVGAFSLGLALALAVVGMLAVRARSHLAPRLGRWARLLPVGSATAIAAAGALVAVRAAAQL
jgi:nickel/cobalt exporter